MTINEDTIRHDIYDTIYDLVSNNVTDPLARSKKWIFSSFPDVTDAKFSGYPFIVIDRASIESSYDLFDNTHSSKTVPLSITVYSSNSRYCDTLSDSLAKAINGIDRTQFTISEANQDNDDLPINGKTAHFNNLSWNLEVDVWL